MAKKIILPKDKDHFVVEFGNRSVSLTNLRKLFWKKLGITKRDLIQYYIDVSNYIIPHLADRAMVMKRYPNGAEAEFFYMKRAPVPRPEWIQTCRIHHGSGNVIDFPIVQDLPSLMWIINLGCIDLNPWYSRCDDTNRPDFLHFDLDPTPSATFRQICDAALIVRDALDSLGIPSYAKTTGSRGIHVYVPIQRNRTQKGGVAIRKRNGEVSCVIASTSDDHGIPCRKAAGKASIGGLQSKCMGSNSCFDLLDSRHCTRNCIHSGELERS